MIVVGEPVQWGEFWWDRRDDGVVLRWNEPAQSWDEWRDGDDGIPPPQFIDAKQSKTTVKARDLISKGRDALSDTIATQQAKRSQRSELMDQAYACRLLDALEKEVSIRSHDGVSLLSG